MSLRRRLMVTTVALVALGLLAANISTFILLKNSLISRIDEQLVEASLLSGSEPHQGGYGTPPERGPGRHAKPYKGKPATLPVTLIETLDGNGNLVGYTSYGLRQVDSPPVLPEDLPGSTGSTDQAKKFFSTADEEGSNNYRVLAYPAPGAEGTVIIAQPLGDVDNTLARLLLVEGLVSAGVLVAAAALALWLVRLGLQPLTRIEHTASEIAAGEDLSRRVTTTSTGTEVGRLGTALNSMLERLEAAFEQRRASETRLRRFIADASHELRTPLTSIRGYAELFRSGAASNPDDLAKSMRRIEEESARMGTLVEEMLTLARLDQDPQLERTAVDLSSVARDAVQDALAVQPDRPIELEVADAVFVEGDEARLRQVAANLLSNALKHAPPDSPILVTVGATNGTAVLRVADQGPGLTAEQAARVFDRFYRVDEARSRSDGGAGLGLSIVSSIVHAHGGKVWVETEPGKGATFHVSLKSIPGS